MSDDNKRQKWEEIAKNSGYVILNGESGWRSQRRFLKQKLGRNKKQRVKNLRILRRQMEIRANRDISPQELDEYAGTPEGHLQGE